MNKIVLITGGASGIGAATRTEFEANGDTVCVMDTKNNAFFVGDVGKEDDLRAFVHQVKETYGRVDVLIHNAPPGMLGIDEASYADFSDAMARGPSAAFFLAKECAPLFGKNASILLITSTRSWMSQSQTETYSAAKGALSALTHSLAMSFAGDVRVNAIAPGWIDTTGTEYTGEDAAQHPAGRVGKPEDIAALAVYLASDAAGFITAQEFVVDGGMTKQMIYHDDNGWKYALKKESE